MKIETKRLILRPFEESDYDDLFEFLSQLEKDEFEGYPGITLENGKEHLSYRLGSDEFLAIELKETGKVIGNICCGKRDFEAREVGYRKRGLSGKPASSRTSSSTGTKTAHRSGRTRLSTRSSPKTGIR